MYAFAGSARTGKTTLAKEVAKRLNIHYHDASITEIMKEIGINGVADLSITERVLLQIKILDKFMERIKAAPRPAICDRTPLDMIGYMLGEITMHNTPEVLHKVINAYVKRCIAEATLYFDMVLIVRPLPTYEVVDTAPPAGLAYQFMVQMVIEGAAQNAPDLHTGVLLSTDFELRATAACGAIIKRLEDLTTEMKCFTKH